MGGRAGEQGGGQGHGKSRGGRGVSGEPSEQARRGLPRPARLPADRRVGRSAESDGRSAARRARRRESLPGSGSLGRFVGARAGGRVGQWVLGWLGLGRFVRLPTGRRTGRHVNGAMESQCVGLGESAGPAARGVGCRLGPNCGARGCPRGTTVLQEDLVPPLRGLQLRRQGVRRHRRHGREALPQAGATEGASDQPGGRPTWRLSL
jgi:hypothetical protein